MPSRELDAQSGAGGSESVNHLYKMNGFGSQLGGAIKLLHPYLLLSSQSRSFPKMAPTKHARVLIAGGSIAGLALANMLEQTEIDFLVLEKYDKIAPDLGASIGVFPNGFRILDQIGVHSAVMQLVEGADAFNLLGLRNDKGEMINKVQQFSEQFIKRYK